MSANCSINPFNYLAELSSRDQESLLEAFACAIAVILMLTFLFAACQDRLWNKSRLINLLLQIIQYPLPDLVNYSVFLVLLLRLRNDLYFVWAVLFLIGIESTDCISGYSLYNPQTAKMYFMLFVDNLIVALCIGYYSEGSKFRVHLWVLWTLITLKMAKRSLSFGLVSDYMQYEHELSSGKADPTTLQGYKYLVHGEASAKFDVASGYKVRIIDLKNQRPVTIDEIWRCKTGLLNHRLEDLCLSFALFKLLRRSFARSPAAEFEQPKTHDLVFRGSLTEGKEDRAFEVVKAELGFLRDLFHTKYPIIFGCGFPTADFIISLTVLGVTGWLGVGKVVYHDYHHPPAGELVHYVGKHNIDIDIYRLWTRRRDHGHGGH